MRKSGLVLAMMLMLAGVSVQGQTGPSPVRADVVIQDDNGGGYFVFDPRWGSYACNLCEHRIVLSGTGQVKVDGCSIYFSHIQAGYRIFASVNMCDQQAKCAIEVFRVPSLGLEMRPILEYWPDTDMRDNTRDCSGPVKTK